MRSLKEQAQFKVGDWVTHTGVWCSPKDGKKTYQILRISKGEFIYPDWPASEGANDHVNNFRLATESEIKKATCLPDGTPCLVCDHECWHLRYADGNGNFYINGQKSGDITTFIRFIKLDANALENLPVNN